MALTEWVVLLLDSAVGMLEVAGTWVRSPCVLVRSDSEAEVQTDRQSDRQTDREGRYRESETQSDRQQTVRQTTDIQT